MTQLQITHNFFIIQQKKLQFCFSALSKSISQHKLCFTNMLFFPFLVFSVNFNH